MWPWTSPKTQNWAELTKWDIEDTHQPLVRCMPASRRCARASAKVVSKGKPLFELQPWWKWNNGRLLHDCPVLELAQSDAQSCSRPSSPSYVGPWSPPPHYHLPPTLIPVRGYSLQYVCNNGDGSGPALTYSTLNTALTNVHEFSYKQRQKERLAQVSHSRYLGHTIAMYCISSCQIYWSVVIHFVLFWNPMLR